MSPSDAPAPLLTRPCRTQPVADMAGALSAAVMAGELSLSSYETCKAHLRARGHARTGGEFFDAFRTAVAMVEDRARRATAFREPRR